MPEKPAWKGVHIRFPGPEYELIENWRRAQPEIPCASKAVRGLALQALKASTDVPSGKRPAVKESTTTTA
jgi:hypothetical protein